MWAALRTCVWTAAADSSSLQHAHSLDSLQPNFYGAEAGKWLAKNTLALSILCARSNSNKKGPPTGVLGFNAHTRCQSQPRQLTTPQVLRMRHATAWRSCSVQHLE